MNRSLLLALAGLVLLGVGFAAGFGIRSTESKTEDTLETLEDTGQDTEPNPTPSPAPGPSTPSSENRGIPATEDPPSLSLEEAVAAIPVPPVEKGAGRITGTVAAKNGQGIEGVVVRAQRIRDGKPNPGDGSPPRQLPLAERVRNFVRHAKWEQATRGETVTDAAGRYVLSGLAKGSYYVNAYRKSYQFQKKHSGKWKFKPGDTADFVGKTVIPLLVELRTRDGSPPASVRLQYHNKSNPSHSFQHTWSKDQNKVRLEPGTYVFSLADPRFFGQPDDVPYSADPAEVTIEAGVQPGPLVIKLREPNGIKGRVVLPKGLQVEYIQVYHLRFKATPPTDEALLSSGESDGSSMNRYGPGSTTLYRLTGLQPGRYKVGASLGGRSIDVSATVTVTEGMATLDLVVPSLETKDYLRVRVLDPEGKIVQKPSVMTGYETSRGSGSGGGQVIQKDDGTLLVRHREPDAHQVEGEVRYYVEVTAPALGKERVYYQKDRKEELLIRFASPAYAEVTVAGYEGSGFEDRLELGLAPSEGKRKGQVDRIYDPRKKLHIDEEGRIKLGPVQPGPYLLVLSVKAGQHRTRKLGSTPVTLATGIQELTVKIPPLYTLTVEVDAKLKGTRMELRPKSDGSYQSTRRQAVGEDGKVVFEDVPAGEYTLQKSGNPMEGIMNITIPHQTHVRFEAKPVNALAVKITDPQGKMAGWGLKTGDLLIGINGTVFKDLFHLQAQFMSAMSKDKARVIVQRDGNRLELDIEPKYFREGRASLGGDFEPASRD